MNHGGVGVKQGNSTEEGNDGFEVIITHIISIVSFTIFHLNSSDLSAYDRQQQQIEIAIAAAINSGISDMRNRRVESSPPLTAPEDDFVLRLIEVVKREPCLYMPSHEYYGNKHAGLQYRVS